MARSIQRERSADGRNKRTHRELLLDRVAHHGKGPIQRALRAMIEAIPKQTLRDMRRKINFGDRAQLIVGPLPIGAVLYPGVGRVAVELLIEIDGQVPRSYMRPTDEPERQLDLGSIDVASAEAKLSPNTLQQREAFYSDAAGPCASLEVTITVPVPAKKPMPTPAPAPPGKTPEEIADDRLYRRRAHLMSRDVKWAKADGRNVQVLLAELFCEPRTYAGVEGVRSVDFWRLQDQGQVDTDYGPHRRYLIDTGLDQELVLYDRTKRGSIDKGRGVDFWYEADGHATLVIHCTQEDLQFVGG
jgi:hypothetical protein